MLKVIIDQNSLKLLQYVYMEEGYSQNPLENFKLVAFCPLCNAQYHPHQASVLEQKEDAHLVYVKCEQCGSAIIALVVTGLMGISSVGLVTDLTEKDIRKFQNASAVTSDDILDFHHGLRREKTVKAFLDGE